MVDRTELLPPELLLEVLRHLDQAKDLVSFALASSRCAAVLREALSGLAAKRWASHAAAAKAAAEELKQQLHLETFFRVMAATDAAVEATAAPIATAPLTPQVFLVLAEWLHEVALAWHLEEAIVFFALRYLSVFLAAAPLTTLKLLQLIGITCLYMAMNDFKHLLLPAPPYADPLALERFADITSRACVADDVAKMRAVISPHIKSAHRSSQTAKHFLQSTLKAAGDAGAVPAAVLAPVGELASFLLVMAQCNMRLSGTAPPAVAAAAYSLAAESFGLAAWPAVLCQQLPYTMTELEPIRSHIRLIQFEELCNLRNAWCISLGERIAEASAAVEDGAGVVTSGYEAAAIMQHVLQIARHPGAIDVYGSAAAAAVVTAAL